MNLTKYYAQIDLKDFLGSNWEINAITGQSGKVFVLVSVIEILVYYEAITANIY